MNILKRFWNWIRELIYGEPQVIEAKPCPIEPPTPQPSHRELKKMEIRYKNMNRRTKFAHSEHFKRRQPTIARMLWKPDAKLEEESN
jgi:hypothetical protein